MDKRVIRLGSGDPDPADICKKATMAFREMGLNHIDIRYADDTIFIEVGDAEKSATSEAKERTGAERVVVMIRNPSAEDVQALGRLIADRA